MKRVLTILFLFFWGLLNAQQAIVREVEKRILANEKIRIEGLKVTAEGGAVTLGGIADLFGSHYYAEKEALGVPGVTSVENNIELRTGRVRDDDIVLNIGKTIEKHLRPEPFDYVDANVKAGFVTLIGNVRDVALREKIFEETLWIKGVRGVENQIEAATVARGDERLRFAILGRLKGEFPEYFGGRRSSVIILVKNGRVALVGNVNSKAHKHKMISVVRSLFGVLSVEDHLRAP